MCMLVKIWNLSSFKNLEITRKYIFQINSKNVGYSRNHKITAIRSCNLQPDLGLQ